MAFLKNWAYEPLSLDEAYLDVTENLRGIPTAWATAAEICARIFDKTSLTASAGISYNKFLAKLASDRCQPNGQFYPAHPRHAPGPRAKTRTSERAL